jgi:putative spermidine/putrescine transport system ATP-binding protein
VGVSNLLERDGRRFTVRPEKIFIVENGTAPSGLHVEEGTIRDVSYAGMITRFLVDLEAGGELQVVRQNLETTSAEVQAQRGRKNKIGWRADQTVAVEGEEKGK